MNNSKLFYNSTIPKDWSTPKFGEIYSFLKSFSFSREQLSLELTRDAIKYIHYGDIHSKFNAILLDVESSDSVPYLADGLICLEKFKTDEFPSLKEGDLIIADASEDYQGLCACIEIYNVKNSKVLAGLHTFAARAVEDKVAIGFRAYSLKHEQVIRELRRISTGISVYSVSKSNISQVKIPLPPLPEQKAIARVLSTWGEAIRLTQELIAQKELQKKWLMQVLLTGRKRLKGYSGKWQKVKISTLFQAVDRFILWDEHAQYNLISIRRRNGGIFLREPLHGREIAVKKLKKVKKDDFLISKRQVSHGAWVVVDQEFEDTLVSDEYDCLRIQTDEKLIPEFWKWFCQQSLLVHWANIDSDGVHIEKSIFNYSSFKKRTVTIPPSVNEQKLISQILTSADKEILILMSKVEMLKEQKNGLMQQLLTGKKRL